MSNIFLFPGNGIYQKDMLNILADCSSVMKDEINHIASVSDEITGIDLLGDDESSMIRQVRVFASEVAICKMWETAGLKADYFIGHSLGEYAAAYISDVFSLKDCIRMLVYRYELLSKSEDELLMTSVYLTEKQLRELMDEISAVYEIAAYNAKNRLTLVGNIREISRINDFFAEMKITYFPMQVKGGSHCKYYERFEKQYYEEMQNVSLKKPNRNIISTVDSIEDSSMMDSKEYWYRHLTNAVDFEGAMQRAIKLGARLVIDLGVSPNLLGVATRNGHIENGLFVPTIKVGRNYKKQIKNAMGQLKMSGYQLNESVIN